ncbi:MAG: hypothetical protein BGN85_08900 [Alphaproteobacteria bacterium 64-11]|nr:MAG: hypothetical protein BGN85_08900 [Alphaproteobacteria bacterium 64-11]
MTRALVIALLCLSMAGCASLNRQLTDASAQKAVAEASTALPDLPAECYRDTPHAPRTVGIAADDALKAERHRTDWANASKRRCVAVYTDLQRAHGPH